jgi:hypothetical protein
MPGATQHFPSAVHPLLIQARGVEHLPQVVKGLPRGIVVSVTTS